MATTTKKGSKGKKANPRRAAVKTSLAKQTQTIAELRQQLAESLLREEAKDAKLQERDRQLAGLFKELKNATQNCARRWSIRPQPPKCSASSAARRRTYSRCSMPLWRVRLGFVELMMWCCDSRRRQFGYPGSFWSHTRSAASRSVSMNHNIVGSASMGRFICPMSARRTNSRHWAPLAIGATMLFVPLRQQGELIGNLAARRTEVHPLHPGAGQTLETFADQAVIAIENVRLVQRTQGVVGTANSHERGLEGD